MENFSIFRHGLPCGTENYPCFFNLGLDLYYRILVLYFSVDRDVSALTGEESLPFEFIQDTVKR